MFRRSPVIRFLAVLFAGWFSVFQAEPAAFHACAMHSAGHGAMAAPAAAHPMPGHEMMGHAPAAAPAADDAPAPHTATQCTCPDGCAATGIVALPATTELATLVAPAEVRDATRPANDGLCGRDADHLLPFANGPPRLA